MGNTATGGQIFAPFYADYVSGKVSSVSACVMGGGELSVFSYDALAVTRRALCMTFATCTTGTT